MTVKKIEVEEIVRDINSGLGDVPIMEKHGIGPSEYIQILERLNRVRRVEKGVLADRLITLTTGLPKRDSREAPRCYLVLAAHVYDSADQSRNGRLLDLSENGFQASGMRARVGDAGRFRIQIEWFGGDVMEAQFSAECRWEKKDPTDASPLAGFEITRISKKDRQQLKDIIDLAALCDE